MAYPASTRTLSTWVQDVDQRATLLRQSAQQQHDRSAAGSLSMDDVRRFYDLLKAVHVFFTQAAAVPGIAAYLTAEKQDEVSDPVAEFQAMQSAIANTVSWLNTNVPQALFSGTNYKLALLFPTDNTTPSSTLVFTAAQTAGYRTVIQALVATID